MHLRPAASVNSELPGSDLVMTGALPANSPGEVLGQVRIALTLEAPGTGKAVVQDTDGRTYPVELELIETLPVFDLVVE